MTLRLMEEFERRLAALGAAIADGEAGRVHDLDEVREELLAEIETMPN